jgi:putative Ca2+/H+ antiporter (TMEM165/GDT1 family)
MTTTATTKTTTTLLFHWIFSLWISSIIINNNATAFAAATTTTSTTTPDLFDQFDQNHDHMIDRMEYENGMTHVISHLQWMTPVMTGSLSQQRQIQQQSPSRSFTTWLMEDVFSYGGNTAATAAMTSSSSSTTNTDPNAPNAISSSSSSSSSLNQPIISAGTTTTTSIWYGFGKAFTSSLMMILATEIGDKTFFIAAILSMKHSRTIVFTGAILALICMTIISTGMGLILPKFLNRKYTHILSGILFLYFGSKLLYDAQQMEDGKVSEELEEVEEELLQKHNSAISKSSSSHNKKNKKKGDDDDIDMEGGNNHNNKNTNTLRSSATTALSTYSVFMMALTLTFVAEWGDRSQIATIALASAKNPIGVTIGAIIGHSICTASACMGGRILASNISEKTVSQYGGIIFLIFGFHSLFFES